jgi:hypothetical protein
MIANPTTTENTYVALDYISINFPEVYAKFNREVLNVNVLALHIECRQFVTISNLYGHPFLMALFSFFQADEQYELCRDIRKQVQVNNWLVGDCKII